MDSVTQLVLGSSISAAIGYKQLGRSALVIGAVLATLPDLDIFLPAVDVVTGFTEHRSFSHSLFVLFPFAFICFLILKLKFNRHIISSQRLFWLCTLVLITHPLLDAFTSYGTQLFWPLKVQPVDIGSMFMIDPLYTLPLLIGCICLLRTVSMKSHEQASHTARRINHIGLLLSSGYLLLSLLLQNLMHHKVKNALQESRIENNKIFISPLYPSLNWWGAIIVDNKNDVYYNVQLNLFTNSLEVSEQEMLGHNEITTTIPSFTSLDWFTKGFIRLEEVNNQLIATDLRMKTGQLDYAFKFAIAEKEDEDWKVIPPLRL